MGESHFNVVLIEPEIPNNTGNIGRTCVGTNCVLHLVGPLGFEISDKRLKRAGLDYWPNLKWHTYDNVQQWQAVVPNFSRVFYFSTKAENSLYSQRFQRGDWLVFGKETKGLDAKFLQENKKQALTIPQYGPIRSLNLANAVAIAVYEGLRQISN